MENPHAAWRIEFARRLVEGLLPYKGIQAVVIGGSVALPTRISC